MLVRSIIRHGRPHPAGATHEIEILPGVVEACAALRGAGWRLVCVTNQPDIARGITPASVVDAQNQRLQDTLDLDAVLVCPHDDHDDCPCRKPRPGLLELGAARFGIDLTSSVMVGDRWRDVEAGERAGCHTVFVDHHYDERRPHAPDLTVGSLSEAIPWILDRTSVARPGMQEQP